MKLTFYKAARLLCFAAFISPSIAYNGVVLSLLGPRKAGSVNEWHKNEEVRAYKLQLNHDSTKRYQGNTLTDEIKKKIGFYGG